jgi:hypothetical protein
VRAKCNTRGRDKTMARGPGQFWGHRPSVHLRPQALVTALCKRGKSAITARCLIDRERMS